MSVSLSRDSFILKNWRIQFDGAKTDPVLHSVLGYARSTPSRVRELSDLLKSLDCKSYTLSDNAISIHLAGESGEFFYYIFPFKNKFFFPAELQPLERGFYRAHTYL